MAASAISGSLVAQAQTSLLRSREDHLLHQINSAQAGNDDVRIEKGAKEFESMLLSTWLQQAEQSMATIPGADDDEDAGARDQMMSLGVHSLATALEASGGIGIASMIARAMHRAAEKAEQPRNPAVSAEAAPIEK